MQLELWKKFSRLQFSSDFDLFCYHCIYIFICTAAGPGRPLARESSVSSGLTFVYQRAHPWANYIWYWISFAFKVYDLSWPCIISRPPADVIYFTRLCCLHPLSVSTRLKSEMHTPYKKFATQYISVIFVRFHHTLI